MKVLFVLLHVPPSFLLAWHHGQREEALAIHDVRPESVVITGSPFFDKWFTSRASSQLTRIDVQPRRTRRVSTISRYPGSSANIAIDRQLGRRPCFESSVVSSTRNKAASI